MRFLKNTVWFLLENHQIVAAYKNEACEMLNIKKFTFVNI